MSQGPSKLIRVGREFLKQAHRYAEDVLERPVGDRQAVESCIGATSDTARAQLTQIVNARSRAYVAANVLAACRVLGVGVDLRMSPSTSDWWIVAKDSGSSYPLGQVPLEEMDAALDAAGLSEARRTH